jgi:hypothetical protein
MAIRERHIRDAAGVLFETAGSGDQDIRMESYRSLGRIAGTEDIDRLADCSRKLLPAGRDRNWKGQFTLQP